MRDGPMAIQGTAKSRAHNGAGLPDFSGYKIPKREKHTKVKTQYTKWSYVNIPKLPQNIQNGYKIYQHFPLQGH
jgi:hypothetical protein